MPSFPWYLVETFPFFKYGVDQQQWVMLVSKERNLCPKRGKEMVPGSVSGADLDEDTSQQEHCAFSFCAPCKRKN